MSIVPTPEQQAILDLGPTSIKVRAGAGTGKTTTVAMAIANLVAEHRIDPERILGMTFTNKAAAELAQRVSEFLGDHVDQSRQVEVHTYHGFGAQLLAEFGPLTGVDARAGVITPTFSRQIISDVFYSKYRDHLNMTYGGTLDRIRKLGDQLGDHLLGPEDILRSGTIHRGDDIWQQRLEMAETLVSYNRAKAELGVVDYADLVRLSTRVMKDHPELASRVRDRYQILVLDEYQDTNPAQRVLITTIFGDGFPVVAVGDEDQTIYEWRGASAENFEEFINHFPTGDGSPAHDKSLTLNRRSGQDILTVANEIRKKANPDAEELRPALATDAEVVTYWAPDVLGEAEWIARQFETLHESGTRWSDMAVLFRKNKDFAVLIDVLGSHDIPLEVANVGGLLSVPEVSYVRAWLTILEKPEDSMALAQILFGSTYRLGIADLAVLTRWLGTRGHDDFDSEEPEAVTLIEAIEQISEVSGLSDTARKRLMGFYNTYRELAVETQGMNLAETCRLILDRTRAWQDIESLPPNPRLTARLNLYRFLDLADDWSPLSGRPSVVAFLDYLSLMEEEPAEELDSARLSGEDAVTLVTVHRAKGLEWENVAIPAVVKGNFPSGAGGYPDPIRFPQYLPVEFRLDDTYPDLPESETHRIGLFRQRHYLSEWRVAYVATTRAKKRLFVTGAYWYGQPEPRKTPAQPSDLFELVESSEVSTNAGHTEPGPRPDLLRRATDASDPDPLFASGWQSVLSMAADDPDQLHDLADRAGVAREYEELTTEITQRLFDLAEVPDPPAHGQQRTVSVTGLVTYAQCPKRFYWSEVDPLPRRRNPAAIRGSEIHRRIELHQLGEVPFEDLTPDLYDAVDREGTDGGGYGAYEDSRFANSRAALVEAPFNFQLDTGYTVRGRIDAIYTDGSHWEVVDFKSGKRKEDPSRIVQLEAYAVAVNEVDFGPSRPESVDVTFAYLGGGLEEDTTRANGEWVEAAREHLRAITGEIDREQFEPTPGEWCHHCDFLRFCDAGQREVNG